MTLSPAVPARPLTRRRFLQLGASALSGMFFFPWLEASPPHNWFAFKGPQPPRMARVLAEKTDGYEEPSFQSQKLKTFWLDLVLPINEAVEGDPEPAHNRIWYRVNQECYVHSSDLQVVEIRKNPIVDRIPAEGVLVEVSVPYTDSRRDVNRPDFPSYRLYYGTTYWIREIVLDDQGLAWYRIDDDKWKKSYYAQADHLHVIEPMEIAPLSPDVPLEEKRLEINLSRQLVTAYEKDQPVFTAKASTGAIFRDGDFRTPVGKYITNRKRPSRHMAAGDRAAANSYDLPGVPWVTYLTESGISFHGTFWHNDFGRPRSHGCINLSIPDARWIYRWTLPSVPSKEATFARPYGTAVQVLE